MRIICIFTSLLCLLSAPMRAKGEIPGLIPVIILIWRLLTYYNYLFIGSALVPKWAKNAFGKKKPRYDF